MFEIVCSLFLLAYTLLPFQNFQQMLYLVVGQTAIWLAAVLIWKNKNFLTPRLLFYFSLIPAFTLRVALTNGRLSNYFLAVAFLQWAIILWLNRPNSENSDQASLFLAITLISPFFLDILNIRENAIVGIALWTLCVVHGAWISLSKTDLSIPVYSLLFLLLSLISIPFSLYVWHSIQFFWINVACVLLFLICFTHRSENLLAIRLGCLFVAAGIVLYSLIQEVPLLHHLGPDVLGMRHHVFEHANTISALYIIFSGIFLDISLKQDSRIKRQVLAIVFILLASLEFLTYSRGGWLGYSFFILLYLIATRWKKLQMKSVAFLLAIGLASGCLFFIAKPVRMMAGRRVQDFPSFSERVLNWNIGFGSVRSAPWFGSGWLNYYSHAALHIPDPWNRSHFQYNATYSVHDHSFFLDLADASGIPLAICAIALTTIPLIRRSAAPALWATLGGITVKNILDTSVLWLTVYPHFWLLLGMIWSYHKSTWNIRLPGRAMKPALCVLLIAGGVLPLAEDHFLQRADYSYQNSNNEQALKHISTAVLLAPWDVLPLELKRKVHASDQQPERVKETLNQLNALRKNYAPYYAELGKISLFEDDLEQAGIHLAEARRLDRFSSSKGETYLFLAELAQKRGDRASTKQYLCEYFLGGTYLSFRARELLDTFSEEEFIQAALSYADEKSGSTQDWVAAVDNFYINLSSMRKDSMALTLLHKIRPRSSRMKPDDSDYFLYELAKLLMKKRQTDLISKLIPSCRYRETAYLFQAYVNMASNNPEGALLNLQRSMDRYNYYGIADGWEALWILLKDESRLRLHYRLMLKFPVEKRDNAYLQQKIAESYYRTQDYEESAREYARLALYEFTDPNPHFWEARMWWLSGQQEKAESANGQLMRLIHKNRLLENLYKSRFNAVPSGLGLYRVELRNRLGGSVWRNALLLHPPGMAELSPDQKFTAISGDIAMGGDVWLEQTDGVTFKICETRNSCGFQMMLNPRENPDQRLWNKFKWTSSIPVAIRIESDQVGDSSWDWAFWFFETAN